MSPSVVQDASPSVHSVATLGKQTGAVQKDRECQVKVRYQANEPPERPWSLTYEHDQPVLTITDMDDSSLGIALRAIASASAGQRGSAEQVSPASDAGGKDLFAATRT